MTRTKRPCLSFVSICAAVGSTLLLVLSAGPSRAQVPMDHTANYRYVLATLCGGGEWLDCLDREPPLTEIDIADLGAELGRFVALSEFYDQIDRNDLLEADFLRLCEEDPARCWTWIKRLARSGSLDSDLDGVLDGFDRCPGTETLLARAQAILLTQRLAMIEMRDNLAAVRTLLIQGANGTLGSAERDSMGRSIEPLFFDLFSIANQVVDGRFVFGGASGDRPPFEMSGRFDDATGPIVTYRGSTEPLVLSAGRSGEPIVVATPGGPLFLGDLDLDGSFPDPGEGDVFAFLKEVRAAFLADDLDRIRAALQRLDELISGQHYSELRINSDTYAITKRFYPSAESSEVDPAGCSQAQFCAAVPVETADDARACFASDYLNDEPTSRSPGDCRVRRGKKGGGLCVVGTGRSDDGKGLRSERWGYRRSISPTHP